MKNWRINWVAAAAARHKSQLSPQYCFKGEVAINFIRAAQRAASAGVAPPPRRTACQRPRRRRRPSRYYAVAASHPHHPQFSALACAFTSRDNILDSTYSRIFMGDFKEFIFRLIVQSHPRREVEESFSIYCIIATYQIRERNSCFYTRN